MSDYTKKSFCLELDEKKNVGEINSDDLLINNFAMNISFKCKQHTVIRLTEGIKLLVRTRIPHTERPILEFVKRFCRPII